MHFVRKCFLSKFFKDFGSHYENTRRFAIKINVVFVFAVISETIQKHFGPFAEPAQHCGGFFKNSALIKEDPSLSFANFHDGFAIRDFSFFSLR